MNSFRTGLTILGCTLTLALHGQQWLTDGLVGFYPFNGNANDESGTGNNGIVFGATLGTNRIGSIGGAYLFSGSQEIQTTFPGPAGDAARTVTGWFLTDSQNRGVLVSYGEMSDGRRFEFGSVGGGFYLDTHSGTMSWAGSFANSAWHHFVLVVPGGGPLSGFQLYLDGTIITNWSSDAPGKIINTAATRIRFGRHIDGSSGFVGYLDDIRLYDRAYSSGEAAVLYALESQGLNFCSPRAASAIPQIVNGFIVGATIVDTGCGYTNPPTVLIQGGGGTGAAGYAVLISGVVSSLVITNAGCCYSTNPPPHIFITAPPFTPRLKIGVSRVSVTQYVVFDHHYVLETSTNLADWIPTGPSFTATNEEIATEFQVNQAREYFRIREVP